MYIGLTALVSLTILLCVILAVFTELEHEFVLILFIAMVALSFILTILAYIIFKIEFRKLSKIINDFSEEKDNYHELYLNFNKINQELNSNNKKLQEANKRLEELDGLKSAFIANISHEIRTPMNSIIGFSHLLCIGDIEEEKKNRYFRLIRDNSQQLLRIVNNMLDISKLETHQFTTKKAPFRINELIDDILIYVHDKVGISNKPIVVRFSKGFDNSSDLIVSDRTHIYQIFTNLIDNAIKFTKQGNIEFGYKLMAPSSALEFYVRDTGKGISKGMQSVVFEQFRQEQNSTSRGYGGIGLGLPIAKGIIELLGGDIRIVSEVDKGSTFYFTIPYEKGVSVDHLR